MNEERRPDDEQREASLPADHPEYEVAERIGRSLGRFARAARAAARTAQPEAERLAKQARDAAEAARPHVQRAAGDAAERAARFLQEHDQEIKRAASTGARIVAYRSTPAYLRPIVSAATEDLLRSSAPRRDPRQEAAREALRREQQADPEGERE